MSDVATVPAAETALLTNTEMARADTLAEAAGASVDALMRAAGQAVATVVGARFPRGEVLVLCGPGNNGGDGFVAASALAARGRSVRVALLGDRKRIGGAAGRAAACWVGPVEPALPAALDGAAIVVDALFGAGLARDLDGPARALVEALAASGLPVVAVDVPSGVDGNTGGVRGAAAPARASVTFFRKKPGHLLLPGRALCGDVVLAEIGLPAHVLDTIAPRCWENAPALWRHALARPASDGHKFDRGYALIVGGRILTGAARLAARAALRAGAGLVTIVAPGEAQPIYRAGDPAVMVEALGADGGLEDALADRRRNVVLLGPGNGADEETRARVRAALGAGRAVVLDADAISAFAGTADALFAAIRGEVVLTPHEGEFARIFAFIDDKLSRARRAAARSGAVVLLKGADTVIAHPDGRAVINANAGADLATAGSGDVLAGVITGLLAQGMPAFEAACAAAWLHGAAGSARGAGLIASDLPDALPVILRDLRA
jgi:ADP-dependent NAD(P)H-hydrate dehydratase / NAD(P)H-hydrate epimerase